MIIKGPEILSKLKRLDRETWALPKKMSAKSTVKVSRVGTLYRPMPLLESFVKRNAARLTNALNSCLDHVLAMHSASNEMSREGLEMDV